MQSSSQSSKDGLGNLLKAGSLLCGNRNVLKLQLCFDVQIYQPPFFFSLARRLVCLFFVTLCERLQSSASD